MIDAFLKLTGLKGESQVKGYEDQIQLLSWQWGMTQTGTMHRGSGGGAGRVNVQDLTFEHYLDAATPSLVAACCTGTHFSEATLTLRKAGGSALDYYVIKLTDIIVSAVSAEDNAGDELVREWVGLNFAAFEVTYQPQDQKGAKRGGAIVKQYDIAGNSGIYVPPQAPAAMNGTAQLEETYKKGNEQFDYVVCASTTGRGNDEVLRHSVFGIEMSRVVLHPHGAIDVRITRNRIGLDAALRSGLQGCVPPPSDALKAFLWRVTGTGSRAAPRASRSVRIIVNFLEPQYNRFSTSENRERIRSAVQTALDYFGTAVPEIRAIVVNVTPGGSAGELAEAQFDSITRNGEITIRGAQYGLLSTSELNSLALHETKHILQTYDYIRTRGRSGWTGGDIAAWHREIYRLQWALRSDPRFQLIPGRTFTNNVYDQCIAHGGGCQR